LKNDGVRQWEGFSMIFPYISYITYYEKQKMFETTNQIRSPNSDILA
jgi:hypothetical protein